MAGKRRATSELNSDNWDRDEPSEEVGVFAKASEDILKKRVFKTARRRMPKPPEEGSRNAFNPASLANLTSNTNQPASQLFSFLSEMKNDVSKTNGVGNKTNNSEDGTKVGTSSLFSFGNKSDNQGDAKKVETSASFSFGNQMEKSEVKTSSSFGNTTDKSGAKSNMMFSFGDNNLKVDSTTPAFSDGVTKKMEFGSGGNLSVNSGNKKETTTVKSEKTSVDHYYARLKGLNQSVAKWINKHVEDNPLINLQPIFKDYERFLEEIEKKYKTDGSGLNSKTDIPKEIKVSSSTSNQSEKETTTPMASFKFGASPIGSNSSTNKVDLPSMPTFKFGAPSSTSNKISSEKEGLVTPSNTFKFAATSTSNSVPTSNSQQPSFKFEASTTSEVPNAKSPPKFSFGGNSTGFTGFTFGSNPISSSSGTGTINFGSVPSNTPSNNGQNNDEEESEEPPKVEVKEVEEEGQIYTIRCKLFVKKDGTFVEKGVGNLFLKPVPDSDKMQVIVRGHNSLANVLCNFILSKSIPSQRMGKNNVMIVCIPTPESKPPPIPVLIKVKTGEDADQLLETLEKHKK